LLKNLEFVIPNGVCEVRNLSFLGILIEEGFIAQKTCDGEPYLASLGMTAKRIFQQPPKGKDIPAVYRVYAIQGRGSTPGAT